MHQTLINAWGILNDAGQWLAILALLGERFATRRRTRRLMAAIEAEAV